MEEKRKRVNVLHLERKVLYRARIDAWIAESVAKKMILSEVGDGR